jgi:UDP-glucose 4-epimerase
VRLLITGGAGFIGSNVARMAVADARFQSVAVIDDLSTGDVSNLTGSEAELIIGSILDSHALERAVARVDVVIHLAAIPSVPRSIAAPVASHEANATGTLLLLEACRRHAVHSLIAASSSSVYGLNVAMPKRERDWVRPLSPYAVSKLATEQYVLAYQSSFGMSSLAFRFFNVYGPGQTAGHAYAAVVPAFVKAILAGEELKIYGDGMQSRDFTYVRSVCEVLLDAASKTLRHPEPVNLAFGTRTTLLELVREIEAITGLDARVSLLPVRPGDVAHSQADNASLLTLFPQLQPTPLRAGLTETIEWFRGLES